MPICFNNGMSISPINLKQHTRICNMFKSGIPGTKIGSKFNLSRERIRQILKLYGISKTDGGAYVTNKKIKIQKKETWLNKIMVNWGIPKRDWLRIRHDPSHTKYITAFRCQYNSALHMSIGFTLTYWEWKKIWDDSGFFNKRGRDKNGYCMARKLGKGFYEIGNVDIIHTPQNTSEGISRYWEKKRLAPI